LRINELAYGDYFPYAHSTIGDMQDLVNAPLTAVQEFFHTHYAPNNAVLSISGDFEPEAAMALVREYFGGIARANVPAFTDPGLAPQTAERVDAIVDANATLPAFHIAYHIPEARAADHYALEVLSILLGDGDSSRLYQDLVKTRELCAHISAGTDDHRGPDLFSLFGVVSAGHTSAEARDAVYRVLDDLATNGITPRELEKAKNRVRAAFVFGFESNMSRAQQLGEFELYFGNATDIRGELARYLAVTADDVKRVAQRYLVASNRTVLDVTPAPTPAAAVPSEGGER
jgi:zinc protease